MSIPQPQMLYTGLNVAVPDWKSFNQDFNARLDMIRREKQQQKQFESQRQDQINREFLKTIDIEQLNFADANLRQQAADIYKGFEGFAANIVEGKKGKLDFQDIMNAQAAASVASQDMSKIKAWDVNHQKDVMVASDPKLNKEIDLEKAKIDVFGYDGKTPYTESRLKIREWTPEEFSDKLKAEYKDANKRTVIMSSAGLGDVKGSTADELTVSFVEKLYDISKDPKGFTTLTLKKDKAIQEVKTMAMSQDYRQGQYGLLSAFDKLPDKEKEIYESLAENETGKKEDAPYSWFVDKHMQDKYPRTITDRKEPTTTSGDGAKNTSGQKVPVLTEPRTLDIGGTTYDNVYSFTEAENIPTFKAVGVQRVKDGKLSKSSDETETVKGKLSDVIVEYGKITKFVIEQPVEKFKTNIDGEPLYSLAGYGEGTLTELKAMTDAKGKDWSIDRIKAGADPIKTTGGTETIILPASKNKALKEKFNIPNVNQIGESKEKTKSYTIKGKPFTEDQVKVAAEKSDMTIEEYIQIANK